MQPCRCLLWNFSVNDVFNFTGTLETHCHREEQNCHSRKGYNRSNGDYLISVLRDHTTLRRSTDIPIFQRAAPATESVAIPPPELHYPVLYNFVVKRHSSRYPTSRGRVRSFQEIVNRKAVVAGQCGGNQVGCASETEKRWRKRTVKVVKMKNETRAG